MNKIINFTVSLSVAAIAFLFADVQKADAQVINSECCPAQTVRIYAATTMAPQNACYSYPVVRATYRPAVRVRVVVGSPSYYSQRYYSQPYYSNRQYPMRYGYNSGWNRGRGYRGSWRNY